LATEGRPIASGSASAAATAFRGMSVRATIVFTMSRTRAPSGTTTRLCRRFSGSTRTSSASLAFICFFSS
jgi:hypothetical protein